MDNEARAAIVQNGSVINVAVVSVDAEGNSKFVLAEADVVIVADDSPISPGWNYENGDFSPPEPTEE